MKQVKVEAEVEEIFPDLNLNLNLNLNLFLRRFSYNV